MGILIQKVKYIFYKPWMMFFFLFPIAATFFFGFLFEKQQQELVIPIAVVNEDQHHFSKTVVKQLKNEPRLVVRETTASNAEKLLVRNDVDSVFYIKRDFQEQLMDEDWEETIELWTSPTSLATGVVRELVASKITRLTTTIKASNRVVDLMERRFGKLSESNQLWNEAYEYTDKQWEPEPLMTIDYRDNGDKKAKEREENIDYTSFLGLWSFFTMLACFFTSDWIVKERKKIFPRIQTMNRGLIGYLLQSSGANLFFHIIQLTISYFLLVHFHMIDSSPTMFIMMVLFIIFCVALCSCVASFISHPGTYYIAGFFITFLIGIIGGSFFPIGDITPSLAALSLWMPQSFFILVSASAVNYSVFLILVSVILWGMAIWRLKKAK
ncbi:ABC transporter permease [Bacillus sp. Gen3]|nr:ABC transporter permease [Bacillus sp. Gen3]